MRIRLSGADREKYNAPEWLEFDFNKVGARQIAVMKRATGWSFDRLQAGLEGREVWENGQLKMVPVIVDGKPVMEGDGSPKMVVARETDTEALAVMAWLALFLSGRPVIWDDDFDIELGGLDIEDDEAEPGKAPPETTTS